MLFSEHNFTQRGPAYGSIEVICGSMFSGKTEELIRRLKRAQYAKLHVEIFKPAVDKRYDDRLVVSHDSNSIPSTPVEHSSSILLLSNDTQVVGIDEAQFFDEGLTEVCVNLANKGIRVIVAGLDMDFKAQPFGPIPHIMAIAEHVTKVHAVCMQCGAPANYSFRTSTDTKTVLLGEKEAYEARCRRCYYNLTNY
ncbi:MULTISPECIES: thymidine kinase [Sphingobacterium]|jgi:thymidine kinase|uniref:Thymidine kinase n=2 Tax=Sphingobacterium TaxID=28453 RepID=A0ABW5Z2S2_9SPHI|nr:MULTISPECIES: thymidine kinase [Sphingobacterium]KKX49458.1 thymidine kinase [Sphingobacterium sp. IITKGP-BTPF85]MBB2952434.1 thymidine kinase [Sphingobacterium sp. JUb56]MCS3557328.1 thymidine kinase [Sphingobacterium sp. JUb21]MCW2260892.1 thymidine kinase [Sphingobacterium kitahiroshimense]TCR01605.1 thymidine kinase [Sphingobacterium sp. JUb20]